MTIERYEVVLFAERSDASHANTISVSVTKLPLAGSLCCGIANFAQTNNLFGMLERCGLNSTFAIDRGRGPP